ncbi:MAG TPA: AMP-binding protein, partial [Acidimicrobiales bacterium]|nr:AMP-binding protein [Acidimicrobiales bacterium]
MTLTAPRAADGSEPGGNPVATLLRSRAGDHRPAYREGLTGRALTWADLAGRAGQWSAVLLEAAAGVAEPAPPGPRTRSSTGSAVPRVGLLLGDPLEMAAAHLGGLAAGVTVAPLDPGATPGELRARTSTLGLTSVLLEAGEAARHDGWAGPHLELWEAWPDQPRLARARRAAPGATVGEAALLLASSGTTGAPKVIPLDVDQLLHTARGVVEAHRLGPDDRGYSPLPLHHINGLVVGVLAALVGGYELTVDRWFSASRFWDVAAANEVTWVNLVPAILGVLAHRDAPRPEVTARVRFARSASAPLARATLRAFEVRTGILVVETYGLTEACSQVTANPPTGPGRRTGSVGVPVGVDLRVVDEWRAPLPPGLVGQVEIRGPSVVVSYWAPAGSDPPERPATDPDGWLSTGDLGWIDGDGYVWLVGRVDDVIN